MSQKQTTAPLIVIMGPTGAGKTELALTLAGLLEGEVVSADSRQMYIGMDIGTDKPAKRPALPPARSEPLIVRGVPHYLIDILTPDQRYSAAEFREDATPIIASIHRRGRIPIVAGGTGFYIRVLVGDQTLPDVPPDAPFRAWAEHQSLDVLIQELRSRAPDLYARVDTLKNRRRVTRALEIARGRRGSRKSQQTHRFSVGPLLKLVLLPPLDRLRKRLEERVDDQFRRGFTEEVRHLTETYGEHAPGLQAVGYRQVLPFLHGEQTLEQTRTAIIRAHWKYARRQRTWLRKEPRAATVSTPEEATNAAKEFVA